jgi:hypothetical protein
MLLQFLDSSGFTQRLNRQLNRSGLLKEKNEFDS